MTAPCECDNCRRAAELHERGRFEDADMLARRCRSGSGRTEHDYLEEEAIAEAYGLSAEDIGRPLRSLYRPPGPNI